MFYNVCVWYIEPDCWSRSVTGVLQKYQHYKILRTQFASVFFISQFSTHVLLSLINQVGVGFYRHMHNNVSTLNSPFESASRKNGIIILNLPFFLLFLISHSRWPRNGFEKKKPIGNHRLQSLPRRGITLTRTHWS